MIKITSQPQIYNTIRQNRQIDTVGFCGGDIQTLINQGDKALNENKNEEALNYYNQASALDSGNTEIYRKKGKAFYNQKNYVKAYENFKLYLEKNPDDTDCLIEMGESLRSSGKYQQALEIFQQAKSKDENNDLANRSILETKNNILYLNSPLRAKYEKEDYASNNLKTAIDMTINYMTPEFMQKISNVQIKFGETAKMGGTSNIAQYENSTNTITVSSAYKYAAPEVIAAYLVHESVHAYDQDPYTSIREEQDAYEKATKFWIKNSNGINDPEMDYAAKLYKKSPQSLKSRVAEIYQLRDPSIAKTSPNHPPSGKFSFNLKKSKAASQSLKAYNAIA
ncbi:MAG: tetratricopeptide repeat protein [Candidatus Gastranaerophilales bacterium]|nr:tetratricopeptide repeat protein [Candidatus Gastranaerophilales bacterium]